MPETVVVAIVVAEAAQRPWLNLDLVTLRIAAVAVVEFGWSEVFCYIALIVGIRFMKYLRNDAHGHNSVEVFIYIPHITTLY